MFFIDFILLRIRIKKLISLLTSKKHIKVKVKLGGNCVRFVVGVKLELKFIVNNKDIVNLFENKKDRKLIQSFLLIN